MAAANITQRSVTPAPTLTQTIFKNALILSFNDAGFGSAPFKEYTSGTDVFLVYRFINDAATTYGTVYFSVKITSTLAISCQLLVGFDNTTNASTGQTSIQNAVTIGTSTTVQFFAINHAELKGVIVKQGATFQPLLWLRPANKRSGWSENVCAWAFHPSSTGLNSFNGFTNTFYSSNSTYVFPSISQMSSINSAESTYDIFPMGAILLFNNSQGYAGFCSTDVTIGCCQSTQLLGRINPAGESYLILQAAASGTVILANSTNVIS